MHAATAQARSAIPVQADYYAPEDERAEEQPQHGSFEDPDDVSLSEDDDEEADGDDEAGSSGGEGDASGSASAEDDEEDEDGGRGGAGAAAAGTSGRVKRAPKNQRRIMQAFLARELEAGDGQGDSAAAPAGQPAQQQRQAKGKRKAAAEPDDGEDSDGYGDGGLSWEAVLACVKVRGGDRGRNYLCPCWWERGCCTMARRERCPLPCASPLGAGGAGWKGLPLTH